MTRGGLQPPELGPVEDRAVSCPKARPEERAHLVPGLVAQEDVLGPLDTHDLAKVAPSQQELGRGIGKSSPRDHAETIAVGDARGSHPLVGEHRHRLSYRCQADSEIVAVAANAGLPRRGGVEGGEGLGIEEILHARRAQTVIRPLARRAPSNLPSA
jgi:hypothetical protein